MSSKFDSAPDSMKSLFCPGNVKNLSLLFQSESVSSSNLQNIYINYNCNQKSWFWFMFQGRRNMWDSGMGILPHIIMATN